MGLHFTTPASGIKMGVNSDLRPSLLSGIEGSDAAAEDGKESKEEAGGDGGKRRLPKMAWRYHPGPPPLLLWSSTWYALTAVGPPQ